MEASDVLTWFTYTDCWPIDFTSLIWDWVSKPAIVFRGFWTFSDWKELWRFVFRTGLYIEPNFWAGLCKLLSLEADGDLAKDITDDYCLFWPIWSIAVNDGLNVFELIWEVLDMGGFEESPPVTLPEYRPETVDACFSLSCLLSHVIMFALLSKLLRDSSSLVLSYELKFLVSLKSFSNFCLSILSSLMTDCFSWISLTFCWI